MNTLSSTGQAVTLATANTYTIKSDEVMINEQLYKKGDLEIMMNNNGGSEDQEDVRVGIQKRDGNRNLPADMVHYGKWTIDTVVQTALGTLVENINTAIL